MKSSYYDALNLQRFEGQAKKRPPYPLEGLDEDLVNIFSLLRSVQERIRQSKAINAVNAPEKRKLTLKHMMFKVNTLLNLSEALIRDLDTLKF